MTDFGQCTPVRLFLWPCRSQDIKRLEGELAASRAEHASTRCALYTAKQAAAEQERRCATAEAQHKQLTEELASQKQQAGLLSTQLVQLGSEQVAAARASAAQQTAAAAAAADLRRELAEARQAAEVATQGAAQARMACETQVQVLQRAHEERLLAAAAAAGIELARQKDIAAAALAAREAALQQQLNAAAAEQERRRLLEQDTAAAAGQAGEWEALCGQLSAKLHQLAGNLGLDPQTVQLGPDDALMHASADVPQHAEQGGGNQAAAPGAPPPGSLTSLPAAMAEVHAGLRQLYCASLELRSRYGAAQDQAAALQAAVDDARQQAAVQQRQWEERLERELRQQGVTLDLAASQQVAAAVVEWRAHLAAVEDRLQGELAQVMRTLAAAQQNREQWEQQCAALAAELLAAQQVAAEGLEAAAASAAAQQAAAAQEACEEARQAAERQAAAEAAVRQEMQAALARVGEQQVAELQAAEAQHQRQLDEARMLADQAAQHHKQASGGRGGRSTVWTGATWRGGWPAGWVSD